MIMSGYDFLKSQVLSCWRKVESVCVSATSLSPPAECPRHGVQQPRTPGHRLLNVWQMALSDDWCHQSVVSASAGLIGNRNEWSQIPRRTSV